MVKKIIAKRNTHQDKCNRKASMEHKGAIEPTLDLLGITLTNRISIESLDTSCHCVTNKEYENDETADYREEAKIFFSQRL